MTTEPPQTPKRSMRTEGVDMPLPRNLRSPSSSSDILSSSGRSIAGGPLPPANPKAAYIAQGAAEHLTSTELDRPVLVDDNALDLVNGFLDQILYNLLHISKSTDIDSLRHAVPKLLKPRLGQAAVNAADEELRDYEKEEDPDTLQRPPRPARPSDFDLELAWKLARLRCMVYARLGDMEPEDEEDFLESERLEEHVYGSPMSVVATSAIFLTSILEFVGEQALCNAAQHAEKRHNSRASRKPVEHSSESEPTIENEDYVALEPVDVLQLGREGALSRLWRSWRRDTRASESFASRPNTPGFVMSPSMTEPSHSRKASHASRVAKIPEEDSPDSDSNSPSQIPLPVRDTDIDEIEVPGLAPDFEERDEAREARPEMGTKRPSSMLIFPGYFPSSPGPASPTTPTSPTVPERSALRPKYHRQRSQSLPDLPPAPIFFRRSNKKESARDAPNDVAASGVKSVEEPEEDVPVELPSASESLQTSRPNTQHSSRPSVVNGAAVAAIAGALGVEAARASRRGRDQHDGSRPQTPRTKTAAEEMMGTSYHQPVAASNPETRASITGPSDFESLHVPQGAHNVVDDPEDLALSSDDEHAVQTRQEARDSGFAVSGVAGTSAEGGQAASSPISPWRNREAAVYENSIVSSPREEASEFDQADGERPRTQESVTFQPSQLAQTSSVARADMADETPPLQKAEVFEDSLGGPQNVTSSTSIPPRISSREPHYGHSTTASKSSQYSHHSKSSSSSSKLLGFTRDQSGRPLKEQRAEHGDNNRTPHSRNASANTSKVIPGAPLGAATGGTLAARREHLRVRTDSEEDVARTRSLEILIKSGETLHYTLTPESARAEEFAPSPTRPKTETQDLADFFRNTGPPGEQSATRPTSSKGTKTMNGLRSNPVQADTASTSVVPKPTEMRSNEQSNLAHSRSRSFAEPRDPRPERNTTRDLADYVRSTGPAKNEQLPKPLGTHSSQVSHSETVTSSLRSDGVPRVPAEAQRQASLASAANRSGFQARDARPTKGSETADLIDFIRQGPPRAAGEHRIDRKVAPFRTTMDSDDLQALAPPVDLAGRSSVGSNHESTATKSMQESTNSRTALLDSSRQTPVRGPAPISHDVKRQVIPEQDSMPPRTRRRVKDPYAIDFSDDEELEAELAAPPKPRREEESLIDFLRNTAPPPGMTTQPILAAGARPPQEKTDLKRSVSNSKLRDILGRGDSSAKNGSSAHGANGAREEPPHLHQRPNGASAGPGVRKPRFEAREAKTTVTSTSDLASYLMNSGPSESSQSLTNNNKNPKLQHSPVKEQAGFRKFFSRKGSVRR